MKKYLFFLAFLAGIVFTGCKWNTEKKESASYGEVQVNLVESARLISPVDWNVTDVLSWDVTFTSKIDTRLPFTVNYKNSGIISVPVGEYNVYVEGKKIDYSKPNSYYTICGSVLDVSVVKDVRSTITVPVSLKKTEEGTGSFEYSLTLGNSYFYTGQIDFDENKLSAYLTSLKNENTKIELIRTDYKSSGLYVFSTQAPISSGFYYLTVKYDNIYYSLPDSLIEIADGLTTKGSRSDYTYDTTRVKTFYISNNKEESYNGVSPEYKIEVNEALQWLSENKAEWTDANLYFNTTESEEEEETGLIDQYMKLTPYFNVDLIAAADFEGKRINIYVGEESKYQISNGTFYVSGMSYNTFYSEADTLPIFDVTINHNNSIQDAYFFYLNNVIIEVSNDSVLGDYPVSCLIPVDQKEKYIKGGTNSVPFITINYAADKDLSDINPVYVKFIDSETNDYYEDPDNKSYVGLGTSTKTDEEISVSYYISTGAEGEINFATVIGEFEITETSIVYFEDSATSFNCNFDENTTNIDDYTYVWYLNGYEVSTDQNFLYNPAASKYTKYGENTLMLVVKNGKEYASKATKFIVKDRAYPTIINNGTTYYGYGGYTKDFIDSYKYGTRFYNKVDDDTLGNYSLDDYAFDNAGNIYVSEKVIYNSEYPLYEGYEPSGGNYEGSRIRKLSSFDDEELCVIRADTNYGYTYKLYYDTNNDIIYSGYVDTSNESSFVFAINAWKNASSVGDMPASSFYNNFILDGLDCNGVTDFAVYKGSNGSYTAYIIYYTDSKTEYTKATATAPAEFAYKAPHLAKVSFTESDGWSTVTSANIIDDSKLKPGTDILDMDFSVNDITVVGTNVYLLTSDLSTVGDRQESDPLHSRGSLAKLSVSDDSITHYGFYSEKTVLNLDEDDDYYSGSEMSMSNYSTSYFFGPVKFVALSPKKLIIADDGGYYEGDGNKGQNKDRIVEVDLENCSVIIDANDGPEYNNACEFSFNHYLTASGSASSDFAGYYFK